ncbi:heme oxygenase-like protein, partial [Agrocybe pediades]
MSSIDYSKPLATLLRDSTHEAHDQVASSEGAKLLLSGGLSKEEYTRYLMMLWHVYDVLERALDRHATHPSLEPTYNPALLARAPALSSDIAYLLQVDNWKSHPIHVRLMSSSHTPLRTYLARLEELSKSSDPSALLAHSYVRYLGDLSGGQTIRHTLAKAYGLDETSGLGVSFYAFKELRSSKLASQGEMKRIKDWFREGLNAAGEKGVAVKKAVVQEASTAFILNAGLFDLLDTDDNEPLVEQAQKTYPIASVIAVIAAICLSHFVLVIGGFTGDKGYEKLIAFERFISNLW